MTTGSHMQSEVLLLGVDGGGTRCRARLATQEGALLGAGEAGPANLRLGIKQAFSAIREAIGVALAEAGMDKETPEPRLVACLALAGASEPRELADARSYPHRLLRAHIITDAEAACIGAHGGADGGIVIAGTGSIGWVHVGGHSHRVGGWGFPISDDGSGAWLGLQALQAPLKAADGLCAWSSFSRELFVQFHENPHEIVRWCKHARPGDYAAFAPLVLRHAQAGDAAADALLRSAAAHIETLLEQLIRIGAPRLSLVGGLSHILLPYLGASLRARLSPPQGDALQGALCIAAQEARLVLQEAS